MPKHVVEGFVQLLRTYSRARKAGFIRCLALLYFCSAPDLLFLFVRRDYSYNELCLQQQGRHDLWCHWLQHSVPANSTGGARLQQTVTDIANVQVNVHRDTSVGIPISKGRFTRGQ